MIMWKIVGQENNLLMKKLFLLLSLISINLLSAQLKKNVDYRKIVLNKSVIGKTFIFGKWNEKGNDELQLTYLGTIKSKKTTYKIMTSVWYWGSGRATSRVLIFNIKNKYLGEYYLTMDCEIPKKIKDNNLQFQSDCEENNQKSITNVSFKEGIPKHLVVKYNGRTNLIASFDTAE